MGTLLRRRYMGGGDNFPYITDGLIDMWDAEWNAGFMEHSSTAAVWKDLGSAGNDLTMRSGENYYQWYSNKLRCEGKGYVASLAGMYKSFQTIECVFSIDDIEHDGLMQMQMPIWADNVKGIMANGYKTTNVYVSIGDSSRNSAILVSDSYSGFNGKIFSISGVFTSVNTNYVDRAYCNGVQGRLSRTMNGAGGDFFTVGGQSGDGRAVKGYIYSIRLYNRALSADEISKNWLVDNSRFNISQQ